MRVILVDDEALGRERLRRLLAREPDVQIAAECADGPEAVCAILEEDADLLFLDVQMPEMDGFGVLRSVPVARIPLVVFVTAYDEYAIRAFEQNALDYLLKPFSVPRFEKTLERARSQLVAQKRRFEGDVTVFPGSEMRIVVKEGGERIVLRPSEIDWIEGANNYACLHCGSQTYVLRETLGSLETRLKRANFVRIHKSVIVNTARVSRIRPLQSGDCRVVLIDDSEVPLSRTHRARLEQLLGA